MVNCYLKETLKIKQRRSCETVRTGSVYFSNVGVCHSIHDAAKQRETIIASAVFDVTHLGSGFYPIFTVGLKSDD